MQPNPQTQVSKACIMKSVALLTKQPKAPQKPTRTQHNQSSAPQGPCQASTDRQRKPNTYPDSVPAYYRNISTISQGLSTRHASPTDERSVCPPASQSSNAAVAVSVDSNRLNIEAGSFKPKQTNETKPKTTDSHKKSQQSTFKEFEPETKPMPQPITVKQEPEFYMARQYMQQSRYSSLMANDQSPPKFRAAVIPARPAHQQIIEPKKFQVQIKNKSFKPEYMQIQKGSIMG